MTPKMKRYGLGGVVLTLAAVCLASLLTLGDRPVEGAVSVTEAVSRVVATGPVRLAPDMVAQSRLLLPAVQRASARVWVVDGNGNVMHVQEYAFGTPGAAADAPRAFHSLQFDIALVDGQVVYSDDAGRAIIGETNGGDQIIAVLIGLLLPAVHEIRVPLLRAELGEMELHSLAVDPTDPSTIAVNYVKYEMKTVVMNYP